MAQSNLILLNVQDISLDAENPRIKQYLEYYDPNSLTSEQIALALSDSSDSDAITTYRALRESIKTSQGIIHPVLVNHESTGKYVVIEGNTRVQIYREFLSSGAKGDWTKIMALVYEDLSEMDKHAIRLQSHLVGPRDWNPYSKAKYIYKLSEIEHLPMNQIVAMCGGKESEIKQLIQAYEYMERYYRPYALQNGYDYETQQFSKFREYQNSRIKNSVLRKGFQENEFAKWVAEGNVDKAQGVRSIPAIMQNEEALKVFLKHNISAAEKVIHAAELMTSDLSEYPYEKLAKEFRIKLEELSATEVDNLANDSTYAEKREELELVKNKLDFIISMMYNMEH